MPCEGIFAVGLKTNSKVTRGKNTQFLIPEKVVNRLTTLFGKSKKPREKEENIYVFCFVGLASRYKVAK